MPMLRKEVDNMRDLQRVLNDEKKLFYGDLLEYKNSVEGLEVQKAFESGNIDDIIKTLDKYYYCRNVLNKFTYASDDDLQVLKAQDKDMATLLHELD